MRRFTIVFIAAIAILSVLIIGALSRSSSVGTSQSTGQPTATPTSTPVVGGPIIQILPSAITATLDTNGGVGLMRTELGKNLSEEPESLLPSPGFYCQHSFSAAARASCVAAGAVGMTGAFNWCEVVDMNKVYHFDVIESWIQANALAGLKSIIIINLKDLPSDTANLPNNSNNSCRPDSQGSPAWITTGVYNNDINGASAVPLQNPTGTYHLNYLDRQAAIEIDNFGGAIGTWLSEFRVSHPGQYDTIEAITTEELDSSTASYSSWHPYSNREMYLCRYGGGLWDLSKSQGDPTLCSVPWNTTGWTNIRIVAATVWRDNFLVPYLVRWDTSIPLTRKMINISNALSSAFIEHAEDSDAIPGTIGLIQYAKDLGFGLYSSGGNMDYGSGNGSDRTGEEFRNFWNALYKFKGGNDPQGVEAGGMFGADQGASGCCDTEQELYWYWLQAMDTGTKYMGDSPTSLQALASTATMDYIKLWGPKTFLTTYWGSSEAVGVWLRDTYGAYYPEGDNYTMGIPASPRGEQTSPSGPTVASAMKGEASIIVRYSGSR